MGSGQSKRTKEPSNGNNSSSQRRLGTSSSPGSPTPTSGRSTMSQHSLRPKASFIRPSHHTDSTFPKQQQDQQQQKQTISASVTRPPIFAGVQSNSFFLPKDWQAEDADHGLHFALKQLFASNILSLVLPKFTQDALIIELGCGHGSWILDMATQFPECQFIGFDSGLDRLPEGLPPLSNVNFQVTTVGRDPIPMANGSVDVVNLRAQNVFLDHNDWRCTLEEVHRVLKPGGMIHIMDYCDRPSGTVMIESFAETVRRIMTSMNRDTDRATKLGPQLSEFGFQVLQTLSKKVHYGSSGKLGEAFTAVSLHRYEELAPVLAPAMGLSLEDYRHRVEMVVAQCVNADSSLSWYAYAARKMP